MVARIKRDSDHDVVAVPIPDPKAREKGGRAGRPRPAVSLAESRQDSTRRRTVWADWSPAGPDHPASVDKLRESCLNKGGLANRSTAGNSPLD